MNDKPVLNCLQQASFKNCISTSSAKSKSNPSFHLMGSCILGLSIAINQLRKKLSLKVAAALVKLEGKFN